MDLTEQDARISLLESSVLDLEEQIRGLCDELCERVKKLESLIHSETDRMMKVVGDIRIPATMPIYGDEGVRMRIIANRERIKRDEKNTAGDGGQNIDK